MVGLTVTFATSGRNSRGDVPASVPRSGAQPVIGWFSTWDEAHHAMVARVQQVTREIGTGVGDVAVLCATRRGVEHAMRTLAVAGVTTINLEDYTGAPPTDAMKVGTIKRAKGLEFKQVLIPDVSRK